jgi:hypothetical protein
MREVQDLGRVLWKFLRAVNVLYRRSHEGREPAWVADVLDAGKPAGLVQWQRSAPFRNQLPRIIRPDLLLTDNGWVIVELDSVPGGIGLTQWLNQTYAALGESVVGGEKGMLTGFSGLFGSARRVHIVVSEEAASYRPEMEWMASQLDPERFRVQPPDFTDVQDGDAVYRFFELFDLDQVPASGPLIQAALEGRIQMTPSPRPIFEEKLVFALFWNRNLETFWRQELGDGYFRRLQRMIPYSWLLDPAPLPPHAAYPGLNLTDWRQLKTLSQKERDLVLKISGFSPQAWGARGVHLGSDLSAVEWAEVVEGALRDWPMHPHVLQKYHKPRQVPAVYWDEVSQAAVPMPSRVRMCPYFFVHGDWETARPELGGMLATLCPADKKIIHGMADAILAPVRRGRAEEGKGSGSIEPGLVWE